MSPTRTLLITVRGRLSDRVATSFDGMAPSHHGGSTQLVGRLVDQAQVHGLLARIRDLGLELESVLILDPPPTHRQDTTVPRNAGTSVSD